MPALSRQLLKSPLFWQIAVLVYWSALSVGTHIPPHQLHLPPSGGDKLLHLAAFAGLASLLATTWQLTAGHLNARHLIAVWLVVVVYAAFDEWTQPLVHRDASIWDWTADAVGALAALVAFAWLRDRWLSKR